MTSKTTHLDMAFRSIRVHGHQRRNGSVWKEALYSDSRPTERFLSILLLLMGLRLLIPIEITTGTIAAVSAYVSQPVCGAWLAVLGAVRLYFVMVDHRRMRWIIAVPSLFTWFYLFVVNLGRDVAGIGTVLFAWLMAQSLWVFLRMPDSDGS